jgi:ribosomal protein S12 methylthiotransferase RimO
VENGTRRVALVTLGCARNEVDSEELAARLQGSGWSLVESPEDSDVVVVNTCGFIEAAKKDSIDTLLALSDAGRTVVAAGCMAERYGNELAEALPEAAAIVGFDSYATIDHVLTDVLAGTPVRAHEPVDRRTLIPIAPVERVPGWTPPMLRHRLASSPVAPLKLASGCDRRCSFCAIPRFRGAFVSRPPEEILEEAKWLASQGVREINLVSENSTSYGKDLGDLRLLESLLPRIAEATPGLRLRIAYLQPAEMRTGLVEVIARHPSVASYFDLSFQHASPDILRRMRRFGGAEPFLKLLAQIRSHSPAAGVRSNVIVGFPGETDADLATLVDFLERAHLDAIGVFGYSDEDQTEALTLPGKIEHQEIDRRVAFVSSLAEELMAQRAAARIGEEVQVIVEAVESEGVEWQVEGRGAHQGPDDGATTLRGSGTPPAVGEFVTGVVVDSEGVDLIARQTP